MNETGLFQLLSLFAFAGVLRMVAPDSHGRLQRWLQQAFSVSPTLLFSLRLKEGSFETTDVGDAISFALNTTSKISRVLVF